MMKEECWFEEWCA